MSHEYVHVASKSGFSLCSAIENTVTPVSTGRWRSWLSHLSNTQKVLSSSLGRLTFSSIFLHVVDLKFSPVTSNAISLLKIVKHQLWEKANI